MESRRAVTEASTILVSRLKLAGLLVSGGLVIEIATLYWSHPLVFLVFIGVGAVLVGSGILLYLYSLVS